MDLKISSARGWPRGFMVIWLASRLALSPAAAQTVAACEAPASTDQALSQRLEQVLAALSAMQQQLQNSQQQIGALQAELKSTEARLAEVGVPPNDQAVAALQSSVEQLREEHAVVQAEVKQQEQTKVESSSKYPVRISGMLLLSAFRNEGAVDDLDQPAIAMARESGEKRGALI